MSNCDVVESVACGKTFQYCRTHKTETKDCPSLTNINPPTDENLIDGQNYCIAPRFQASKREIKVGDKVVVNNISSFYIGHRGIVDEINLGPFRPYPITLKLHDCVYFRVSRNMIYLDEGLYS